MLLDRAWLPPSIFSPNKAPSFMANPSVVTWTKQKQSNRNTLTSAAMIRRILTDRKIPWLLEWPDKMFPNFQKYVHSPRLKLTMFSQRQSDTRTHARTHAGTHAHTHTGVYLVSSYNRGIIQYRIIQYRASPSLTTLRLRLPLQMKIRSWSRNRAGMFLKLPSQVFIQAQESSFKYMYYNSLSYSLSWSIGYYLFLF